MEYLTWHFEWDFFLENKNAKIFAKFHVMTGVQKEVNVIFFIFDDNLDYTQRTRQWEFPGKKRACFIFHCLVSLDSFTFRIGVHCFFVLIFIDKYSLQ